MKRLVLFAALAALVIALPATHTFATKGESVEICHVNSANSPAILENYQLIDYSFDPDWPSALPKFDDYEQLMTWTWYVGRVISVDESAVESHVAHGDSTTWYPISEFYAGWLTRTLPLIDEPRSGQAYWYYQGQFYLYWWSGWFRREWTPAVLKNANCYWVTVEKVLEVTPN